MNLELIIMWQHVRPGKIGDCEGETRLINIDPIHIANTKCYYNLMKPVLFHF